MSRRYLTIDEAEAALNRGKAVECFIGSCKRDDRAGIEWLSITKKKEIFEASIFQSADFGDEDYLDLYSFGPLNEDLEYEDADQIITDNSILKLFDTLKSKYSNQQLNFVNQFVIQDEYLDFIKRGRL